jgi:hypothetical protein
MSQLNVDVIKNKAGTGGPTLQALTVTTDATVTGVVTASSFVGPVTGNVTGNINSTGVSTIATLNATQSNPTNLNVSGVGTIVTLNSTQSNPTNLNVSGVGTIVTLNSTQSNPTNLNVSGVSTLTTLNGTSGLVSLGSTIKTKGFVETQTSATNTSNVLSLDAANGTVFTHTTTAQIGIVSFSGIRTDTAGTQTFSVLVTQGGSPTNTTGATGIGTQLATVRIHPGNIGYSTHIKVGAGSSIILTGTAGALDLLTFIVSYDGTAPSNSAFRVVGFAATDFRNAIV